MKYFLFTTTLLALLVSCDSQQSKIDEIRSREYLRLYEPAFFQEMLQCDDAGVRYTAAMALARLQKASSLIQLVNALNAETDPAVKKALIFALGQLPQTAEAETHLLDYARGNPNNAIAIAISGALGKAGTPRSLGYLQSEITHSEGTRREAAAIAAGLLARQKNIISQNLVAPLEAMIEMGDKHSWAAAYVFIHYRLPNKITVARQLLKTADSNSQVYLVKSIYKMIEMLPALQSTLDKDTFNQLRKQATDPELWSLLNELLAESDNWRLQLAILTLFSYVNPDKHVDTFRRFSQNDHHFLVETAVQGLNKCRNIDRVSALQPFLRSNNSIVLENALNGTVKGMLQNGQTPKDVVAFLQTYIDKPDQHHKIAAIKALTYLKTPQSYGLINTQTMSENTAVALAAFENLSAFNPQTRPVYMRGLNHPNMAIVSTSAIQLTNLADSSHFAVIRSTFTKFNQQKTAETAQDLAKLLLTIASQEQKDTLRAMLPMAIPAVQNLFAALLPDSLRPAQQPPQLLTFGSTTEATARKAIIETTRGTIELQLLPAAAPQNVANFMALAKKGYYDGLFFHRVIGDFVIQGGDPDGTGWGGPGYAVPCEYNTHTFTRGAVGIALAGKDTGGSQFFICHSPQPHLDGKFTVFAKVVVGMEIVDQIRKHDQIVKINIQ
jgi:peptidyl-prolyl cis-trans isomerase B (cyclophilin B)